MKSKSVSRSLLMVMALASLSVGHAAGLVVATNLCLVTPGSSWALEIDTPGFQVQKNSFSPDGMSAQLMAVNDKAGIIVSAFLEKATTPGDAKVCREHYWSQAQENPMTKENIRLSETGAVAQVEYLAKDLDGLPVNQQNLNAYLSTNGYWVDVHLSKMDFKPEDEAAFQAIVQSIHINGDFITAPLTCATWDSFYMAQKNFPAALRCSERALELDKAHGGLTHEQRIMVLEDVINCYGNMGNDPKATELSEEGLKEEPDYPQFYYDIACGYGDKGDKVHALEYLRRAFQNKGRLFAGDTLADPRTDSSFANYAADPDFVNFYAGLKP